MPSRSVTALAAVVLSVLGWALVYISVGNSWALLTGRGTTVGPLGLVVSEVVRIAPALVYFLAVGIAIAHVLGSSVGLRWAAFATAIAMALQAATERHVFFDGIDTLAVAILGVNYLLPVTVAVVGASIARLWQRPRGGTIAT
jgi:hypothetical protein